MKHPYLALALIPLSLAALASCGSHDSDDTQAEERTVPFAASLKPDPVVYQPRAVAAKKAGTAESAILVNVYPPIEVLHRRQDNQESLNRFKGENGFSEDVHWSVMDAAASRGSRYTGFMGFEVAAGGALEQHISGRKAKIAKSHGEADIRLCINADAGAWWEDVIAAVRCAQRAGVQNAEFMVEPLHPDSPYDSGKKLSMPLPPAAAPQDDTQRLQLAITINRDGAVGIAGAGISLASLYDPSARLGDCFYEE